MPTVLVVMDPDLVIDATQVATSVGTLVKSKTTSKDTIVISWGMVCPVMTEAHCHRTC